MSVEKEKLYDLYLTISGILNTAPEEWECTDKENELFSDMANLKETIEELL